MLTEHSRLRDPLVASIIFAPAPWNHMLSAVSAGEGFAEAIALDWMMEQDSQTVDRILRSQRRDAEEVKRFVAAFCEQLEQSGIRGCGLQAASPTTPTALVLARDYPFAGHLNLLGLPVVEGISFDADDFIEH
jgi:hypothetical protein